MHRVRWQGVTRAGKSFPNNTDLSHASSTDQRLRTDLSSRMTKVRLASGEGIHAGSCLNPVPCVSVLGLAAHMNAGAQGEGEEESGRGGIFFRRAGRRVAPSHQLSPLSAVQTCTTAVRICRAMRPAWRHCAAGASTFRAGRCVSFTMPFALHSTASALVSTAAGVTLPGSPQPDIV